MTIAATESLTTDSREQWIPLRGDSLSILHGIRSNQYRFLLPTANGFSSKAARAEVLVWTDVQLDTELVEASVLELDSETGKILREILLLTGRISLWVTVIGVVVEFLARDKAIAPKIIAVDTVAAMLLSLAFLAEPHAIPLALTFAAILAAWILSPT